MATLLSFLGFTAQFCVIASFGAVVISSACLRTNDSVLVSEDHPSGAVVSVDEDDSDATLPTTSSYSAKSMTSPLYTTVVDKLESSSDDLSVFTIRQLKALCRERGIKRYSSLRKAELIELLQH
jgi:hypothetical protein